MSGFLQALKESLVGHEVELPICSLARRKPLRVFYTYVEDRPQSHTLRFRKGNWLVFNIGLRRQWEDIASLIAVAKDANYPRREDDKVFGFWSRLQLRMYAGRLISSRPLFSDTVVDFDSKLPIVYGNLNTIQRYRMAVCQRGTRETVVLVSTRESTWKKRYSTERKIDFNWLRLSSTEFRELIQSLEKFLGGKEYGEVRKRPAENPTNNPPPQPPPSPSPTIEPLEPRRFL